MSLDLTLKGAAIALLALSGYEFLFDSRVPLIPVVLANILFVLSIFSRAAPRRVAVIATALAFVIPAGAFRSYFRGETALEIAILNVPIFAWVAYVALQSLRTPPLDRSDKTPDG